MFGNALGLRGLWVETGNARRFGEFITDAIGYQHPSYTILEWTKREDSRLQVRPGRRWFGFSDCETCSCLRRIGGTSSPPDLAVCS